MKRSKETSKETIYQSHRFLKNTKHISTFDFILIDILYAYNPLGYMFYYNISPNSTHIPLGLSHIFDHEGNYHTSKYWL